MPIMQTGPGRWLVRINDGSDPVTGKERRFSRRVTGTEKDALQAEARLRLEVGSRSTPNKLTVADLLAEWYEAKKDDLSPKTREGYESSMRTHIIPQLGGVAVSKLRPDTIDRFYRDMFRGTHRAAVGPWSVARAHIILSGAFRQAERWGWVDRNPVAMTSPRLPHAKQQDDIMPDEMVHKLLDAPADAQWATMMLCYAATAMRRAELAGLQRGDVKDGDAGAVVHVRRALTATSEVGLVVKTTKKGRSREIAIDSRLKAILDSWRASSAETALALGVRLTDADWLFSPTPDHSRPWRPDSLTQKWERWRERCGYPEAKLHGLRHYAASRMLLDGAAVQVVQRLLGHARASTTLDMYAHAARPEERAATAGLADRILNTRQS